MAFSAAAAAASTATAFASGRLSTSSSPRRPSSQSLPSSSFISARGRREEARGGVAGGGPARRDGARAGEEERADREHQQRRARRHRVLPRQGPPRRRPRCHRAHRRRRGLRQDEEAALLTLLGADERRRQDGVGRPGGRRRGGRRSAARRSTSCSTTTARTSTPSSRWRTGPSRPAWEQFLFVSSAGIYKPTDEPPHVEGDAVKESAGHVGVEKYIAEQFSSWASFRPQYMIGSGNNKDCEEWFFDRVVRKRPVPIPGNGMQLTNIAHVRDLSSMLALAVENPGTAAGKIFNCVSDRAVTLDGMARLCAAAAGAKVEIVHYDPAAVGVEAKKAFPFRNMHFYSEPRAAKEVLGWTSTTNLPEDLKERYAEYASSGRGEKAMTFDLDDKILAAVGKAPASVSVSV